MADLFAKIFKNRDSDLKSRPNPENIVSRPNILSEPLNIMVDEWFFISAYGIGDLYILLSLLAEFRRVHQAKRISIGIVKESHRDLFDLFPGAADRYVMIGGKELKHCKSTVLEPGRPIIIHPKDLFGSSLMQLIGYKSLNIMDLYKVLLKLPLESRPAEPRRSNPENASIVDLHIKKKNLVPGRTILLAPDAFSYDVPPFDFDFWRTLSNSLMDRSYKIVVLSSQKKIKQIKGVIPVYFPLREAIPFVEHCGFFIGNRSGFCDLISQSKAMKIFLYPRIPWYSGLLFEGSSLTRMGLANNNICEMEYDSDNWKEKIETIVGILGSENHE